MALHEKPGKSDEWYTPVYVLAALGCGFDYDPCPPHGSGGLTSEWRGFVWMNPPFGGRNGIKPWLDRFFEHGNGVALTPDRTSAPWWQEAARKADAVLFVSPKIRFIPGPGVVATSPAQGTTLMAAGAVAVQRLAHATELGVMMVRS